MSRRRTIRRKGHVASHRSGGGTKEEPMKARLHCPACGWRDAHPVVLDGRQFRCPHCETHVFGWDGRPVYLHGGQRGLAVGTYLLPPAVTGAKGTIRDFVIKSEMIRGDEDILRGDRVYLTTRWDAAVMYAVYHPSLGQVYLAEPIGELEEDPDCNEGGISYQVPKARITKAIDVPGGEVQAAIKTLERYGVILTQDGPQEEVEGNGDGQQQRQEETAAAQGGEPNTTEGGAQGQGQPDPLPSGQGDGGQA